MITNSEKAKIKILRDAFLESVINLDGVDTSSQFHAEFVGANMAVIDALFAIREGETWRNVTAPKEIARTVLKQWGVGE